ncbi:MAG TPA: TPM domain-containing protein [Burkholderiales bacterium]
MKFGRAFRHLVTPHWLALRAYPPASLKEIEQAIKASERQHAGEMRFAVEAGLPLHFLKFGPRRRAEALFSELRVWDTAHNNGVLLYVQLVDRAIEIVADRGIAARVEQAEWNVICRAMEERFRQGQFREGALEGIAQATRVLARHFPPHGRPANELPDKPAVLP